MNTDIRIAILTLSRGIIQSKADPLRREKLCPNLLSPKFADAQMSSNFLPKFFVLKYIEPKVLAHKFLNIKVYDFHAIFKSQLLAIHYCLKIVKYARYTLEF